jgi:hypothetical protein
MASQNTLTSFVFGVITKSKFKKTSEMYQLTIGLLSPKSISLPMGEVWGPELLDRRLHEECRLNSFSVSDPESDEPPRWVTPRPWKPEDLR